jgi:hypothetical protein
MQITIVTALKQNYSQLVAGKYSKSTKRSTLQHHHQANEGKSSLERKSQSPWGIAQRPIQKEHCGIKTIRCALLMQ